MRHVSNNGSRGSVLSYRLRAEQKRGICVLCVPGRIRNRLRTRLCGDEASSLAAAEEHEFLFERRDFPRRMAEGAHDMPPEQ